MLGSAMIYSDQGKPTPGGVLVIEVQGPRNGAEGSPAESLFVGLRCGQGHVAKISKALGAAGNEKYASDAVAQAIQSLPDVTSRPIMVTNSGNQPDILNNWETALHSAGNAGDSRGSVRIAVSSTLSEIVSTFYNRTTTGGFSNGT